MAVTPQTNCTLEDVAAELRAHDDIVLCGHVSPDGDCLGSQLALASALVGLGKQVTCLLVKDETPDERLGFLPGIDRMVPAASFTGQPTLFVAVDVPLRDRMGTAAAHILDACQRSITIDHHAVESTMTDLAYVDPDSASTTCLIWELAGLLGQRNADVALCCYTGAVTDTGRFQYQNTDAHVLTCAAQMVDFGIDPAFVSRELFQNRTFPSVALEGVALQRMVLGGNGAFALSWLGLDDFAAAQAEKSDAEPIIDVLRSLRGVRVACMLREQEDSVRGSFRAKDDTDVAELARALGGGGHKAAAGFTVSGPLDVAVARIKGVLDDALGKER